MARDFMQDILPKDEPPRPPKRLEVAGDEVEVPEQAPEAPRERSIRNININVNRQRPVSAMPPPQMDRREVPPVGSGLPPRKRTGSALWLWLIAGVLLIAVVAAALFMFRSTSVTVVPRAHTIVFDQSKTYTAYPAPSAPAGALTYTVQTFDVDDSQPVTSSGTTHSERKASGTVTVVNGYSPTPVKLVKNTRFQTPDGLIFRAPADISVPGMNGTNPGSVNVTLVADQAGDKYNVGPTARFSLPGLQGGAMYDKVYARSSAAFSGGFSGDEPSVTQDVRSAAVAEMQGRLKDKVAQQMSTLNTESGTIFPQFASVTFEERPATAGTTQGQVNLNERAHVQVPVFATQDFNKLVGGIASTDTDNSTLTLTPKQGFAAMPINATSTSLGTSAVSFSLSGTAQLVWGIDTSALTKALAGKDQAAFQTVVNSFPGVQEARARIEPFWQHSFPADPKDIQVVVSEPQEASTQ